MPHSLLRSSIAVVSSTLSPTCVEVSHLRSSIADMLPHFTHCTDPCCGPESLTYGAIIPCGVQYRCRLLYSLAHLCCALHLAVEHRRHVASLSLHTLCHNAAHALYTSIVRSSIADTWGHNIFCGPVSLSSVVLSRTCLLRSPPCGPASQTCCVTFS